jgi:tripartite ATP-independent transporter DctM subunit
MSPEFITLLLFATVFALLFAGLPIAFALGGTAVVFAIAFWGVDRLYVLATAGFGPLQNDNLIAIPLFILMGWVLYKSGIAEDLFEAIEVWLGNLKGGLAMGTVIIAAIFAAICGDMLAAIFTVTTISLVPLLKRGYDKNLAIGTVMAGGLLGMIIPPSITVIIFSSITGLSVGRMYLGCFLPGFLLAFLYILYILIRGYLNPELVTRGTGEAKVIVNWGQRMAKSKGVLAPVILLLAMLVGIYSGAVTPMEASAIGAAGAFICAAIKRRLNWQVTWEALLMTARVTCMIGWLFVAVGCFSTVYSGMGALDVARDIAFAAPGGGMLVIIIMQLVLVFLGMVLDDIARIMIFGPIFLSVVNSLGFDTLWFGVLFMVNSQTAYMTPPYGMGLFAMRICVTTIPEVQSYDISLANIYRAATPFVLIQIVCLAILLIFPSIATFLPNLLI